MVDPLPALTGLGVAEKDGGKAAGVRADGAVTLQIGEEKYCESGELQFTSYGPVSYTHLDVYKRQVLRKTDLK